MTTEHKVFANAEHWYEDGVLHRDNDEPAIIYDNGLKVWYQQGVIHRDNGPAVLYPNGGKEYYKYGKWHNENGPAIESTGVIADEWWLNGHRYSEADWKVEAAALQANKAGNQGMITIYFNNPVATASPPPDETCEHPEHSRYPEKQGKIGCYKCGAIFD